MNMNNIESTVSYDGKVFVTVTPEGVDIELDGYGNLFHRIDYWEDGSQTNWYGIELSEKAYKHILELGLFEEEI